MEQQKLIPAVSQKLSFGILLIAILSSILASAKWGIGFFAWLAPLGFLFFFRVGKARRKLPLFMAAILVASVAGAYDVAPFPFPLLVIVGLLETIKLTVIYLLDRQIIRKSDHFLGTLFYPAAMVSMEFLNTKLGSGTWWSTANTQLGFSWFSQLASVTGIWGISFLIYWFASLTIWTLNARNPRRSGRIASAIYGTIFGLVLVFGAIRYEYGVQMPKQVRVAGVTVPTFSFLENLYQDFCGKKVRVDPRSSITSGALQEINRAQMPFVETADTLRFREGYAAMHQIGDSLFTLSQRAADHGAKIIIWSEANALALPYDTLSLQSRGRAFAVRNKVYLLMAMAVIYPGKITAERKFLENKAILIGPSGQILNVFHKNHPVPFAEASIPGDGNIPVIETPYGKISTSICFDADFPAPMRQLGVKESDLLLLPSGDWHAIAPYHTYMAIFRGIENGTSILRQASGGLSAASDYRGKVLASFDFYQPGDKIWMADLPIGHVRTLYTSVGDSFAYACLGILAAGMVFLIAGLFAKRMGKKKMGHSLLPSA